MNAQTRLSAKGQIVIPKAVREDLDWAPGTRLAIEKIGETVLLRPIESKRGRLTVAEFVERRPKYEGPPLSLEEIDTRVEHGMAERFAREYDIKG